jgi:hypothetical protein
VVSLDDMALKRLLNMLESVRAILLVCATIYTRGNKSRRSLTSNDIVPLLSEAETRVSVVVEMARAVRRNQKCSYHFSRSFSTSPWGNASGWGLGPDPPGSHKVVFPLLWQLLGEAG